MLWDLFSYHQPRLSVGCRKLFGYVLIFMFLCGKFEDLKIIGGRGRLGNFLPNI